MQPAPAMAEGRAGQPGSAEVDGAVRSAVASPSYIATSAMDSRSSRSSGRSSLDAPWRRRRSPRPSPGRRPTVIGAASACSMRSTTSVRLRRGRRGGTHHDELVAAQTGRRVRVAEDGLYAGRHLLQDEVADAVAEGVVDRLEPVEVEQEHPDASPSRRDLASACCRRSSSSTRFGSPVSGSCIAWNVVRSRSRAFSMAVAPRLGEAAHPFDQLGVELLGAAHWRQPTNTWPRRAPWATIGTAIAAATSKVVRIVSRNGILFPFGERRGSGDSSCSRSAGVSAGRISTRGAVAAVSSGNPCTPTKRSASTSRRPTAPRQRPATRRRAAGPSAMRWHTSSADDDVGQRRPTSDKAPRRLARDRRVERGRRQAPKAVSIRRSSAKNESPRGDRHEMAIGASGRRNRRHEPPRALFVRDRRPGRPTGLDVVVAQPAWRARWARLRRAAAPTRDSRRRARH